MATPYTDGDWTTARINGTPIVSVDENTRSYIYSYNMMQFGANWAKLAIDTTSPGGTAYLVAESEPSDAGGGVLEWNRTYAELPDTRNEYIPYVHNAQYAAIIDDSAEVLEMPRATTARVQYDYFRTTDPGAITILRAYKLVKLGQNVYNIWPPDPGYDTERVAEDSVVERWKWPGCNFWERRTVYVYQVNFAAYVTP